MNPIRYTLLANGSSDRCLRRVINWILDEIPALGEGVFVDQIADLRVLRTPPSALADRMREAVRLYPCEVLFVHRDAEGAPREDRLNEISRAAQDAGIDRYVAVVPVRMIEAWLLIDEDAIRTAAGNPNGTVTIDLPRTNQLERLADPKRLLRELLQQACELTGRRRDRFRRDLPERIQRVADLISDFRPLYQLPAFGAFASDAQDRVRRILRNRAQSSQLDPGH